MAASLNRVFLMGNLTRDPELRYTQTGTAIVKFGLAVNRRYRDNATNQWRDEVDFVDCVAFARQAEVISEYCRKGKPVFIEGRLSFSSWETETGDRRSKLEVVSERCQFLGSRDSGGGQDSYQGQGGPQQDQGGPQQNQGGPSQNQGGPPQNQGGPPPQDRPPDQRSSPPPQQPPSGQSNEMPPYDETNFADDEVPF